MKKIVLFFVVIFAFTLTACAQEQNYGTYTSSDNTTVILDDNNETISQKETRFRAILFDHLKNDQMMDQISVRMDKRIFENENFLEFSFDYFVNEYNTDTKKTRKIYYDCYFIKQKFNGKTILRFEKVK